MSTTDAQRMLRDVTREVLTRRDHQRLVDGIQQFCDAATTCEQEAKRAPKAPDAATEPPLI